MTILGVTYTRLQMPNNHTLYLYTHPLFEEVYEGAGVIVDREYFRLIPYGDNAMFTFHEDIQENDRAGQANEWQIICTCEPRMIEPHGIVKRYAA